jgi:GNAT superfamily N-acetyltransferase
LARGLLERAAQAFPAVVDQTRNGWRLRHTDTSMWWAGAVLAHQVGDEPPLDQGIDAAERFYAVLGASPRFQVCPGCPGGLDAALVRRGYRLVSPMTVLAADTDRATELVAAERGRRRRATSALSTPELTVRLSDGPDPTWFEIWSAVHAAGSDPEAQWRLLRQVRRRSCYVTVHRDGEAVAVGRTVGEAGWAGVFAMATLPGARGCGAGTAVLEALCRWAADEALPRLYLQLEDGNDAARRLYDCAGFTDLFSYHYRVSVSGSSHA